MTLPLVAAACNNTKTEPKPNTDQEAVNKSLDNIAITVDNKDKTLPSAVTQANLKVTGQVEGFNYTYTLTADDKTGTLKVQVKSEKGGLSATKDIIISEFKKETSTPNLEEEKLRNKIVFKHTGKISGANNFDLKNIKLENNDDFAIDMMIKKEFGIKIKANSSIFIQSFRKYVIAKLTLKNSNKSYDFYVKFEIGKTNSTGAKVSEEEFNETRKQQKEIKEQELKNKIVFKYEGKISEDNKGFDFKNIKLANNDDFEIVNNKPIIKNQIKLEGMDDLQFNKKYAAIKLDIKKENRQIPFYLKFETNVENPIGYKITKEEFDGIVDNLDVSSLKYKYKNEITEDSNSFDLDNIEIVGEQANNLKIEEETIISIHITNKNYWLARITLKNNSRQKSQYIYLKIKIQKAEQDIEIIKPEIFNGEFAPLLSSKLMEKISEIYKNSNSEKNKYKKMVNNTSNVDELLRIANNIELVEKELGELKKNIEFEYTGKIENKKDTLSEDNITVKGDKTEGYTKKLVEQLINEKNKLVIARIALAKGKLVVNFYVEFNFNSKNTKSIGKIIESKDVFEKLISDKNKKLLEELKMLQFKYEGKVNENISPEDLTNIISISNPEFKAEVKKVVPANHNQNKLIITKINVKRNNELLTTFFVEFLISPSTSKQITGRKIDSNIIISKYLDKSILDKLLGN
ncbi:lipoprotein 17-related variable surface protein [[Mycoplasma] phocae]|uniref:lipoprotein 17-related variable surface protein n=1 Tax=[Mycoplasma] phocae TaxID=142651 RepID=UPI0035315BDF